MEGEWVWETEQRKDVVSDNPNLCIFWTWVCISLCPLSELSEEILQPIQPLWLTDVQVPAHATTQLGQPRMLHALHQLRSEFHTENQNIITFLGLLI